MAVSKEYGLLDRLIEMSVYAVGPFFCYPHKLALGLYVQDDFGRAYQSFKRDHSQPLNLILHGGCLLLQLGFNFQCLGRLDQLLGPKVGKMALTTALGWSATQVSMTTVPSTTKLLTSLLIFVAYSARERLIPHWHKLLVPHAFVEAAAFSVLIAKGSGQKKLLTFSALLAVRLSLGRQLEKFRGAWRSDVTMSIVIPILLSLSYKPFVKHKGLVFFYTFLAWAISILTNESAVFLHGCGFSATLLQGIAHNLSNEGGTLPQLDDPYEQFGHTLYFPTLAVQRLLDLPQLVKKAT